MVSEHNCRLTLESAVNVRNTDESTRWETMAGPYRKMASEHPDLLRAATDRLWVERRNTHPEEFVLINLTELLGGTPPND